MVENSQKSISGVPCIGALVDIVGRKLDAKRRLTVRAGWREVMGNPAFIYLSPGFVVVNGSDSAEKRVECIEIIPPPVLNARLNSLQGLDEDDPKRIAMERYCLDISQVYFDTEGRIRISERLLEYAGISEHVMMSGANDRIKVWAVDAPDQEKKIDFEAFKKARIGMSG